MPSRRTSKPLGGAGNFSALSSFFSSPVCTRADAIRHPTDASAKNITRIIVHLLAPGHVVRIQRNVAAGRTLG